MYALEVIENLLLRDLISDLLPFLEDFPVRERLNRVPRFVRGPIPDENSVLPMLLQGEKDWENFWTLACAFDAACGATTAICDRWGNDPAISESPDGIRSRGCNAQPST
uniref:Uncharacterized protein n=1 Tax=Candidatus Kentrum eta TaxID=2126337 RepID=A0A450V6J9_9GAMM|nr:MAG: hypothetical protein BECKH772A_GA0070896_101926 [Candidatus Kentron sp. H]VFK00478.1 MAG: hypothetical protein BECKH772B_GA0070898_101926 [Candidatus Kentron sp. H]VFK04574.1 MAG: hypothetical protein BECKH772C_GA0070978_101906 [Candidatus Kentron sp. H]